MSSTTTNMGLTKPALGGDSGTWDDSINSSLDVLDSHDHTTGSGVQVPTAGIGINADLTFGGYSATNLKATQYTVQASSPALARSLWVKTSDNELYWRNASGTDVKMTSGTGLNMSLVGGIAGDYSTASASLYYDDAAQAYRFLEAAPSPNSWSRVLCGDLDLYEHASGISNRVRLSSPAALAASYAMTFPAALPGSTSLMTLSSAGAIAASNTVGNAVTFSALTTHSAGATMASGQHVTVSGSGEYKHGDMVLALYPATSAMTNASYTFGYTASTSGGATADFAIPLKKGDRVKSIVINRYGPASGTMTFRLWKLAGGTTTDLSNTSVSSPAASWTDTTLSPSQTIGSGEVFFLGVEMSASGMRVGAITVTYDRP